MPVYKDKNNKWYVNYYYTNSLGEYKTKKSKRFETKKEALEEERKIAEYINSNSYQSSTVTFKQAYEQMLIHNKDIVKYSTYRNYPALWKYCAYLENMKIKELTVPKYQAFKEELNKMDLTVSRKNAVHKFVKQIINFAKTMYDVDCNAPSRVGGFKDVNKLRTKNVDFFTYDEFSKFIACVDNKPFHALFMTLYHQGTRIGEANALTWNDIDFEKHTMTINKNCYMKAKGIRYVITSTKRTASDRILPIEHETEEELKELYKYYASYANFEPSWFVFGGGEPISMTTLTNAKNKACKDADVKQIRIHDFRHSCASFLVSLGCQPTVIQKYLGHASLKVTLDTYSHLYPSALNEANDLMNAFKKNKI